VKWETSFGGLSTEAEIFSYFLSPLSLWATLCTQVGLFSFPRANVGMPPRRSASWVAQPERRASWTGIPTRSVGTRTNLLE